MKRKHIVITEILQCGCSMHTWRVVDLVSQSDCQVRIVSMHLIDDQSQGRSRACTVMRDASLLDGRAAWLTHHVMPSARVGRGPWRSSHGRRCGGGCREGLGEHLRPRPWRRPGGCEPWPAPPGRRPCPPSASSPAGWATPAGRGPRATHGRQRLGGVPPSNSRTTDKRPAGSTAHFFRQKAKNATRMQKR